MPRAQDDIQGRISVTRGHDCMDAGDRTNQETESRGVRSDRAKAAIYMDVMVENYWEFCS
jgi:hypothetical protein